MRIVLACGGTGGHVFPGLATAEALRERGHDVSLWLAGKAIEPLAVSSWSGETVTVPAEGLPGGFSLKIPVVLWKLGTGIRRCTRLMRREPPDAVLAMGSYASIGPAGAALRLKRPLVLHESNAVPGRAVTLLAPWAAQVAACFEATRYYLRRKDIVMTGMPLRRELEQAAAALSLLPRPPDAPFTLLVTGGSRGAQRLNEVVSLALCALKDHAPPLRVVHLTGREEEEIVRARYTEAGLDHDVRAFSSNMAGLYRASHFALCRGGASTCAELSAFGLPALLVPYPYATRDHQTANARALEKIGAAEWIAEKDLSVEWLIAYLRERIRQPETLRRMSAAARGRWRSQAAGLLADVVEQAARAGLESGR